MLIRCLLLVFLVCYFFVQNKVIRAFLSFWCRKRFCETNPNQEEGSAAGILQETIMSAEEMKTQSDHTYACECKPSYLAQKGVLSDESGYFQSRQLKPSYSYSCLYKTWGVFLEM